MLIKQSFEASGTAESSIFFIASSMFQMSIYGDNESEFTEYDVAYASKKFYSRTRSLPISKCLEDCI